jgi:signal transduction histidine kinase
VIRLTPQRRVMAASLLAVPLGFYYLTWAFQLGRNIIRSTRGTDYIECSGSWRDLGTSCNAVTFNTTWAWTWEVLAGLIVLGVAYLLARWALQPLRALTAAVERLGPQNLGERSHLEATQDEVGRLAQALDAMMDRVAEGYEGQRRFAANASHELRTPLAVQRTLIEVSMAGSPTADQLELLARQLLATNERNEALIEGLLVLAESDRGLISRTPLRLDELAARTVELHAAQAGSAAVELRTELAPTWVTGEQVLLERLLTNLLQNAIKYNVPGGWVQLRVDGRPTLSVTNSGEVIAPTAVAGLFEPFRRLTGDRVSQHGGSGLGLTIARSIAQAHHGTISARARPDGGLIVDVQLPTD